MRFYVRLFAGMAVWWEKRRPQIVDMYEKYVYGRIPNDVPHMAWTLGVVDHERIGATPVIAKELIGHVDHSSYPAISVNIHMMTDAPNMKYFIEWADKFLGHQPLQQELCWL